MFFHPRPPPPHTAATHLLCASVCERKQNSIRFCQTKVKRNEQFRTHAIFAFKVQRKFFELCNFTIYGNYLRDVFGSKNRSVSETGNEFVIKLVPGLFVLSLKCCQFCYLFTKGFEIDSEQTFRLNLFRSWCLLRTFRYI